MATFSTWTSLLTQLKDDLASRDLTVGQYRGPDGVEIQYRSLAELRELEAWVGSKAEAESASSGIATRRTYAKPFSGGPW